MAKYDVISIFPEYLKPLELSLIGKAREAGLVDIKVTDLREFAEGIHKSVDDTPYGGGAGMVMSPEPWGKAINASRKEV
jgi:tRNA (guanine37-N1)-methyltransferase